MKKTLSLLVILALAISLFSACGNAQSAAPAATNAPVAADKVPAATEAPATGKSAYGDVVAKGDYTFYVIYKSVSSDFWRAAIQGSESEAATLGVKATVTGPASNTDIADQVQILNNAINAKPDGIALAASDKEAVMDSLKAAKEAGIPVICVNSGVPNAPEGSVLATAKTDNYSAGGLAATNLYGAIQATVKNADAPIRIGVINQDATSDSIINRGLGFIDKMIELVTADGKSVAVVGNDKYVADCKAAGDEATADVIIEVRVPSQATSELCATEAGVLLNKQDLVAVMATNSETTEGLITADELLGKLGSDPSANILAAGFDSSPAICAAVESGVLYGAVTQSPLFQGQIAIDLLIMVANGEEVHDEETPCCWYNAANINDPDVAPNLQR